MPFSSPPATPGAPLKIWDISPPVDEQSAVFPGDTAYSQALHFSLTPRCPVNVNRITMSPHTGAHADAPLHYANGQASAGELELAPYGPCRVIHCIDCGPLVLPGHIDPALENLPPRVLLRTARAPASQPWASFTAVAQETLALLATKSMRLSASTRPAWPVHHSPLPRPLQRLSKRAIPLH